MHDVAVTIVNPLKTIVGEDYPLFINVTVQNQGAHSETFNVTVYANSTVINQTQITLAGGNTTSYIFTWDTTAYNYGYHIISAFANYVPSETDTTDNFLTYGDVMVTIPGDVNGDRIVDIFDIGFISSHWYPGPPIGPSGYHPNADINGDGAIDIFDIGITSANWGQSW